MCETPTGGSGGDEHEGGGHEAQEEHDLQWLAAQLQGAGLHLGEEEWADPSDPSGGLLSALFDCCEQDDAEQLAGILEEMCAASVDVNTPGPDGDSALHLACLYGSVRCVKLLLEHGADASVVNPEDGSTPLHDACASGDLELVELVLSKCPQHLQTADADADTPLHNAARGCHKEVVELLLSKGASPLAVNGEGLTPRQECDEELVMRALEAAEAAARIAAVAAAAGES